MKVVIAIAHQADVSSISEDLRANGYRFTRIPSIGGFLEETNVTFLLAVEDEQVTGLVECFERSAHARDVDLPPVLLERLADWRARTVHHGGATILILDLEAIHRT